ncbi:hypothetical protein CCZ01_06115 [Helicobacter monodelphidis]|uniref:hypothetical protein n=1 Tax=Helicobacter sp. 15-1451 TaxID=2004995 RepID=UPI000DCDE17A|nr:hypothetical protein [Helicobacter sp. 15-1451]RAX57410.1 hypothetical protein CCZ01_06115 [Helicobacter sp. 15-1451]
MVSKEKDKKLEKIVRLLCEEQNLSDKQNGIINDLVEIYTGEDKYRHQYSKITTIILYSKDREQSLMTLAQNIRMLEDIVDEEDNVDKKYNERLKDIKPELNKLYDHINLECIRLQDFDGKISEIKEMSKDVERGYKDLKNNLDKQQTQYVTILGIFASIVLAFVGGLVFSTSVLSNIDKASIYRLVFVMAFIALFFGNILYALFNFLSKIVFTKSDSEIWDKTPVCWFNAIICIIIVCNFIVYMCNHR